MTRFKPSNVASLPVGIFFKLVSFGFQFFVGDDITGVELGIFGQGYQALGPNHKSQIFD